MPAGGTINIVPDGTVFFEAVDAQGVVAPVAIGQLLMRDASTTTLQRRTDGLFEAEGSNGAGGDFATGPVPPSLVSGSLEGSNVNPVEALVSLMGWVRQPHPDPVCGRACPAP